MSTSGAIADHLWAGAAPWMALALLLLGRNPCLSRIRIVGSLLLAFFVLRIPAGGWHLFAWVRLLEPAPSVTGTLLLAVALIQRVTGRRLFRRSDWVAAALFGSLAALTLYPTALGLTRHDAYGLGWGWGCGGLLPLVTTVLVALLLVTGNRFGLVLLAPVALRALHLREGLNFWEAVIDPFYAAVSLLAVFLWIARRVWKSRCVGGRGSHS